jgi:hypothetical protein
MQFPKHISFELSHNECASVYATVAQIVEQRPDYYGPQNWVSEDQMAKAIETDSIWTAHWYPETPVGFCVLHAAELEPLMAAVNETF